MKTLLSAALVCLATLSATAQQLPSLKNMSVLLNVSSTPVTVGVIIAPAAPGIQARVRLLVRVVTWNLDTFGLNPADRVEAVIAAPGGPAVNIIGSLPGNDRMIAAEEAAVGAFARRPATALVDAAYIVEAAPGALTVTVRTLGRSGDAIIEVYQLPGAATTPP